jgi:hypothetical protein
MSQPQRIQRRRTRGYRLPPQTRCVTRPGPFGNPFPVACPGDPVSHGETVARFETWLAAPEQAEFRARVRRELRGVNLACYCRPELPCHADVLLRWANESSP